MKKVIKAFAWLQIIWGSLGLAANASALYLSMTTEKELDSGGLPSDDADIFVVIVFHLFLIVAGFYVKSKASA